MGSNSRFEYAEERISIPEDRSIEIIQSEENKGKKKINRALETCGTLPSSIHNDHPKKKSKKRNEQKEYCTK